jgi:hypothetical protein
MKKEAYYFNTFTLTFFPKQNSPHVHLPSKNPKKFLFSQPNLLRKALAEISLAIWRASYICEFFS